MTQTDPIQSLIRAYADHVLSDPPEKVDPAKTTSTADVLQSMMVENTGKHILDSGFENGRAWQQNRENPPWEKPVWRVERSYVVKNVYHHLLRRLDRDDQCVAVETCLYAFGRSDDRKREAWRPTVSDFLDLIMEPGIALEVLTDLGVPPEVVDQAVTIDMGSEPDFHFNTYNGGDCGSLSQIIQGTQVGGPYGPWAVIRLHNGADVRGGYTAPKIFKVSMDMLTPGEFWFSCQDCDNDEAESILIREDDHWVEFHPDENEATCADCGGEVLFG